MLIQPSIGVRSLRGKPQSNSTRELLYYDRILNLNPRGGNQSDVDWTRLTACQPRAPTVACSLVIT
jgi:hypothetical protein